MKRVRLACCLAGVLVACGPPPELASVSLDGPRQIDSAGSVRVIVTGINAMGTDVVVEVHAAAALSGKPVRVETHRLTFDENNRAALSWRPSQDLRAYEGVTRIRFVAVLGEQSLRTDTVELLVQAKLTSVAVRYESPLGVRPLTAGDRFPQDAVLDVEVRGLDLPDFGLVVVELLDGSSVVDRKEVEVEGDVGLSSFRIPRTAIDGRSTIPIRFVATRLGQTVETGTNQATTSGLYGCAWFDDGGRRIPDNTDIDAGTSVRLRASTWGLDGTNAVLEIFEADSGSGDDFINSFTRTVTGDLLEATWITEFTGDGPLDNDNEYYFSTTVGTLPCRSEQIVVKR